MSVFDKELIINGKAVRSPEQQVFKNMKDIEILKSYIKETYKCVGELDNASISIAKPLTNVPDGVEDGWLLDPVGNLFKITGADDYSLLLEYYSTIVGAKGDKGDNGSDSLVSIENITINKNNFVESTTYTDYPYEYVIQDDIIKGAIRCGMLLFDVAEANSGNYASVCNVNGTLGTITIYSKVIPEESFVIPQIWLIKA